MVFADKRYVYRYGFFEPEFNLDCQNKAGLKQWVRGKAFLEKEIARLFETKVNAQSASILIPKHTRLRLEISIGRYLHTVANQYEEVIESLSDKAISDKELEVLIPLASKIDTYKAAYEFIEAISFETLPCSKSIVGAACEPLKGRRQVAINSFKY